MLIAAASDIHGMWSTIDYPKADVLCLAGDILANYASSKRLDAERQIGELEMLDEFMGELIADGVYKHVILVAGNHDFVFEVMANSTKDVMKNMIYLQDSEIVIDGVKFYGSPWQPWFWDWAFNFPDHNADFFKARAHARVCWDKIPLDTVVLVTHAPPFDILDECYDGEKVGCKHLKERLKFLKQLKLHIFGHIHHSHGLAVRAWTRFINASICSEQYVPSNRIRLCQV